MALYSNEMQAARMLRAANPTAARMVAAKIRNALQPIILIDEVATDAGALASIADLETIANILHGDRP